MADQQAPRMSLITDWRVRDESELPDIQPGEEYERAIRPQMFVVLHGIVIRGAEQPRRPGAPVRLVSNGLCLSSLRIGAVLDVPFELDSLDVDSLGEIRKYRPKVSDETIKRLLVKSGAAAAGPSTVAVPPGMEIWLVVRNEGTVPTKPRAALLVQEESS